MPVDRPIKHSGSAPIKKVGHTASGRHGSEPNAKRKGIPAEPTPLNFGGK